MSTKIRVPVKCYCCEDREPIKVDKPKRLSQGRASYECKACSSITTYRMSIRGKELKIETIFCRATELGRKIYKERTGEEYAVETKQD